MEFSDFGKKMSSDAGILQLMDDLGKALASEHPQAMFGGGNPAHIPAVTAAYTGSVQKILKNSAQTAAMLGNYDAPQGNRAFVTTIVEFLNRHYNLGINEENIAITPGSQAGYFMLFNLLAGKSGTTLKKILFPLVPEYIGYVDQTLEPDMFASQRPRIERIGQHEFKYCVDFDNLDITDDIAGICLSRPTNPTGNVITDEELAHLGTLAASHNIPLIIDNAYGLPFPGVVIPDIKLFWNNQTILSISLSKVGLPSSRVGIFVGPPDIMRALASVNAIVNLASPSFGQYVAMPLIANDEIIRLSDEYIKPYYFERAQKARALMERYFPADLPWRLHSYEGSYFFWLWCEGAKKTSKELYAYLKEQKVIVVPGEYFFPGQDSAGWPHANECLRLNFARPDSELESGIPIIAQAIQDAYR